MKRKRKRKRKHENVCHMISLKMEKKRIKGKEKQNETRVCVPYDIAENGKEIEEKK